MKHLLHLAALAALTLVPLAGQNIDQLPPITGQAVDKASDKIMIRDASVSAAAGALRQMPIGDLGKVPGLLAPATTPYQYGAVGTGDDTAAIQGALNQGGHVQIPAKATPWLISEPLTISSNTWLDVADGAVIQLKPGNNVVMLINANPENDGGDSDIRVTGGYWNVDTTGNPGVDAFGNGYLILRSEKADPIRGIGGVMSFVGVERLEVSGIKIMTPKSGFTIQAAQCKNWRVERIQLEKDTTTISDGIHVNGPTSNFVIRDIRGSTGDDFIALNAWDWLISTPEGVQGTIEKGYISNLRPTLCKYGAIKIQIDGSTNTEVRDIVIEDVQGFSEGPSFPWGRWTDAENPENTATGGHIRNVVLRDIKMGNAGEAPPFGNRRFLHVMDATLTNVVIENTLIDETYHAWSGFSWAQFNGNCALYGVVFRNLRMNAPNPRSHIIECLGQAHDLLIDGCRIIGDGTRSGEQGYSPFTITNNTIGQKVRITNSILTGLGHLVYVNNTPTGLKMDIEGCEIDSVAGLLYTGNSCEVDLSLVNNRLRNVVTNYMTFGNPGTTPAVFVRSSNNVIAAAPPATVTATSGALRWDGIDLPVNYQLITPTAGDWIKNINSAGGVTIGRIKWDGSAWSGL